MGHKISKEQLDPSVIEFMTAPIGNLDELETEDKSSLVNAINSLLAGAEIKAEDIGKIAEAIGKPVTVNDSIDDVVSKVNGLITTFKANMMNNGVTVEAEDRFKTLIDKIASLADSEGKGLQFATGEYSINTAATSINIPYDPGFVPTYLFAYIPSIKGSVNYMGATNCIVDNIDGNVSVNANITNYGNLSINISMSNISSLGFTLGITSDNTLGITKDVKISGVIKWYAIGVGEEDTTLRDSLASILGDKGVDVTEDDDMASLISKIDKELNDKNNELNNIKQEIIDALVNKGIDASNSEDISKLLDKVDAISVSRLPVWYNPENTWMQTVTAKMSSGISEPKYTATLGDLIYVFNGGSYYTYNAKTNVCSAATTYTNLPDNSELSRGDYTVVNCNGTFYIVGGLKSYSTDRQNANNYLMAYNPNNGTWSTKANMITALNQPLACVYNNKIYVFGGRTYKEYYSGNYLYGYSPKASVYDPAADTWTAITDVPNYKLVQPLVVNNAAYLPSTAGNTTARYKYDFTTDTYTEITSGLTGSSGYTVYKNRIYQFNTTVSKMYDTTTGTETDKTVCSTDKSSAACHTMGDLIYSMGGTTKNSNGYYQTTYYYGNIYIPEK